MPDAAPPSEQPQLGLVGRAVGVITSPAATFADVVRAPRPALILLVVSAVIAIASTLPQMTERGRQAILQTQIDTIERFTGQPVSDEVYAQMEANSRRSFTRYLGIVATFVWMPIMALFFTAILWGLFNLLLGGTATFKQVLGIVTHSMVIMAVGAAVSAPIQMMQATFSLAGPFNLGALVPMLDPEGFVARFLTATSAITIWQTIVLAIGLLVVYGALVGIGVAIFSAFAGGMGS